MIYLDHAAATPVLPQALEAMMPYFSELFFNPSAPYLPAKHVRQAYEVAKDEIAHVIGAKGVDLVVTAGATESINLAFTACQSKALISSIEHAAVMEAAKAGNYDLLEVDKTGMIVIDDLRKKLNDEIDFISVSLANNELGTIQPLAEIAELVRQVRQDRLRRGVNVPLWLHSDASQALSLMDINVARMGVDLLTLNAAKCGGPKGVGALYVGHGIRLRPVTVGGGQERGLRSGTENVPGVIGFAAAVKYSKDHLSGKRKAYQEMTTVLRKALSHTYIVSHIDEKVKRRVPEPLFLGNPKHQLASFMPVSFPGIDAERLIYKLEQRGILVSTGAACAANKGSKSHVLTAIGLTDEQIAGSLRISLGSTNNLEQIKEVGQIIQQCVCEEYSRSFLRGSGVTTRNSALAPQRRALATRPEKNCANILDSGGVG